MPLLDTLRKVADAHNVKPSAVALKWVIQKGAIPLGGVKNSAQAEENAEAADDSWTISSSEMEELETHTIVGSTTLTWQHG
jgi:aryl-alcohol dehydrogenase-like predicted oxidoreductase